MIRLLLLTLLAFHPLSAQVVTADNCVHQAGDNPKWARPDFDDSQWSKQFPANGSPYVWTRCRIDLSPLPRIAPLLIGVLNQDPWELFVNGVPAGSSRIVFAEHGTSSFEQRGIPSAAGAGPTMTLALRQRLGRRSSRSLSRMLVAGTNDSLAGLSLKAANAYLWESGPSFLGGAILCTIGFLLLLLFCYAKDSRQMELLWFSMVSLSIGSIRIVEFVRGVPNNIPDLYFTLLVVMANVANGFAYPRIFFALAGKRLPRFYYWVSMGVIGLFALFGISALLSFTQRLSGLVPSLNVFLLLLASAAVAAFWPPWQIPRPLRLASILCLLLMFGSSARQLTLLLFPSSLSWVTAATNIQSVFMLVSLCGLFVVIAQRHRQVALDRAELQGEMKSAQEVQRLLTSSTLDVAPWAAVEVAYLPAKEVGGDFYFSRQTSEGQLIVVGDVSGKAFARRCSPPSHLGQFGTLQPGHPDPFCKA